LRVLPDHEQNSVKSQNPTEPCHSSPDVNFSAATTREDALPISLAMTAWGFLGKREKWSQAAAAPAQSGK
jgi:hypothetical protein